MGFGFTNYELVWDEVYASVVFGVAVVFWRDNERNIRWMFIFLENVFRRRAERQRNNARSIRIVSSSNIVGIARNFPKMYINKQLKCTSRFPVDAKRQLW